jgi:nucleolar protein 15
VTVSEADPPAKKSKKATSKPTELPNERPKPVFKKRDAPEETVAGITSLASLQIDNKPTRVAKPRKRAADFLSDGEEPEPKVSATKFDAESTASRTAEKKSKQPTTSDEPTAPVKGLTSKLEKVKKDIVNVKSTRLDDLSEGFSGSSDSEPNGHSDGGEAHQTVALIKGFESSGDEDPSEDEGFDPNEPLPKIPDSKKTRRKLVKKLKKTSQPEEPGTVYIG